MSYCTAQAAFEVPRDFFDKRLASESNRGGPDLSELTSCLFATQTSRTGLRIRRIDGCLSEEQAGELIVQALSELPMGHRRKSDKQTAKAFAGDMSRAAIPVRNDNPKSPATDAAPGARDNAKSGREESARSAVDEKPGTENTIPPWQQLWSPDGAPWWTDAKKTLLTQFLALVLTPVTVAVTVFITETYKSPSPRIEYVRVEPISVQTAPSRDIADRIRNDPSLVMQFRRTLYMLTSGTVVQENSDAWLEGQQWDPNLATKYRKAANQLIEQLKVMKMYPLGKSLRQELPHFDAKEIDGMVSVLNGFVKELDSMDAKKAERNGALVIILGVLNRGASDGTIFDEANLKYNEGYLTVFAEKYTPIKAHGFEEISFITPRAEGEGIISANNRYTIGEEDSIKAFTALIKKNEPIPLVITIRVSDKQATHQYTLPGS